jgi:transposase
MEISNINSVPTTLESELSRSEAQQKRIKEDLLREQQRVNELYRELLHHRNLEKALRHFSKVTPADESTVPPPSENARKKFVAISPQIRALIVRHLFYDADMSWEQAMATFKVSRASISRILKEERALTNPTTAQPKPKKKRGRHSPLSMQSLVHLLTRIESDSQLTLQKMVLDLKEKFGIESSTSAIDRALKKLSIMWKTVLPIPVDWNTVEVIHARQMFVGNTLVPFLLRPKVYIDESGFNLHTRRTKGRAIAGQPATITLMPKGHRISLIAALGQQGIVHHTLINSLGDRKRGVNAEDFRSFILDLAPKIARNSVLILDNAKIHHAETLQPLWQMLRQTYGIEHIFLPPYSPFLNPIEYAFDFIKTLVKSSEFYNRGELTRVILQKIQAITPEKAEGFFMKSQQYYPQCQLGFPFQGTPLSPDLIVDNTQSPTNPGSALTIRSSPSTQVLVTQIQEITP